MAPKPKPKVIKIVHKPTQKKAETCKAPKSHNSSLLKKDKQISKASLLQKIETMRKELKALAAKKKMIKGECTARNRVSKQKPAHQSRTALKRQIKRQIKRIQDKMQKLSPK